MYGTTCLLNKLTSLLLVAQTSNKNLYLSTEFEAILTSPYSRNIY